MSYYSYYNFKRRKIMLVYDFRTIGNKLLAIRKKAGLTQSEVADAANLSDRTYADIERGTVNMRIETILKICGALHITPDAVLTDDNPNLAAKQAELLEQLDHCTVQQKETSLELLSVYLRSTNGPTV
ncbi:MAG: helix-turn-helix transcriptional regulator [Lachnospira sp.]|nr:helix-turn-helix transcriptional regulator [Lachnospira sp.]